MAKKPRIKSNAFFERYFTQNVVQEQKKIIFVCLTKYWTKIEWL